MKSFVSLVIGMAIVAIVGCGAGSNKLPSQAEIAGTVTLDGMPMTGELRCYVGNEPPITLPVSGGAFTGKVFVGANRIDVLSTVDGPPHPMDPTERVKVNIVDPKFSGPNSPFKQDVPAAGLKDLKFEVTSRR
ncbi:hypothetical protein [Anatilimnocola floriformis]|uniref:hypothetical protein n=1 Tax=Anatilimnocola floriformis TaxID=2948575 RepID=UPI0020C28845|nr:hypothetical protein [Anatilimnocola floriformis]